MFSVIIPAHNEESVIGRCLTALYAEYVGFVSEVIVVCNGCTDNTAAIASSFPGVQVVELQEASKIAALNAGDAAASLFPRVYLDADITCSLAQLSQCIAHMQTGHQIAAPQSIMEMRSSSWLVKSYLSTWMQLPYYQSGHMVGSGIYILTEQGRGKFSHWPNVIADDAYVRALFQFEEIYVDKNTHFSIYAPRTVSGLVKIRTRARFGNMQLESIYPETKVLGENNSKALLALLFKRPFRVIDWCIYVVTQMVIINKCKAKLKAADFSSWERDDSARLP